MRDLVKNQQKIYHKRYLGKTEINDSDGFGTGSFIASYGSQTTLYKNVMSAVRQNQVSAEMYGTLQKHQKVIVTSEFFDVGENDLFWIGVDQSSDANYQVGGIYQGLTTLIIGLDKIVKNV